MFPWSKSLEECHNDHLEKLGLYQKENGHCRVPQCRENRLGSYVNYLDEDYKVFISGGKGQYLTKETVAELNKIGIEWSVKKPSEDTGT